MMVWGLQRLPVPDFEQQKGNRHIHHRPDNHKPGSVGNRIPQHPAHGSGCENPPEILQPAPGTSQNSLAELILLKGNHKGRAHGYIIENNVACQSRDAQQQQLPTSLVLPYALPPHRRIFSSHCFPPSLWLSNAVPIVRFISAYCFAPFSHLYIIPDAVPSFYYLTTIILFLNPSHNRRRCHKGRL